jgi:hypothetical protein
VSFHATAFVQIFYPTTIFVSVGVVIVSLWSSVAYVLKRFNEYWLEGYPILLVVALSAYGVLKSPIQPTMLAMVLGVLVVGYIIGRQLGGSVLRFIPIATVIVFLIVGELSFLGEGALLAYGLSIGLLIAQIIKNRYSSFSSMHPPSSLA